MVQALRAFLTLVGPPYRCLATSLREALKYRSFPLKLKCLLAYLLCPCFMFLPLESSDHWVLIVNMQIDFLDTFAKGVYLRNVFVTRIASRLANVVLYI